MRKFTVKLITDEVLTFQAQSASVDLGIVYFKDNKGMDVAAVSCCRLAYYTIGEATQ